MDIKTITKTLILIVIASIFLAGCLGYQTRLKSSVVDYLYPNESDAKIKPSIPVLNIPVNVGIAFVPEQTEIRRSSSGLWSSKPGVGVLSEATKAELLEKVAANFRGLNYVDEIEVIPTAYLTPGGGFSNLEQIRTMYGIDIIALVSYDQIQFTDEGFLSLTYWTIIGAYIIAGEKNDTQTMLDTAVYDIKSKKMLLRAPGTSNIKGRSTIVNLSEELRNDSLQGFEEAATDMISNLGIQLEKLKEKIRRAPEKIKVINSVKSTDSRGGGGSGAGGIVEILIMFGVLIVTLLRCKNSRRKLECPGSFQGSLICQSPKLSTSIFRQTIFFKFQTRRLREHG